MNDSSSPLSDLFFFKFFLCPHGQIEYLMDIHKHGRCDSLIEHTHCESGQVPLLPHKLFAPAFHV
jgi:hypothetical protein